MTLGITLTFVSLFLFIPLVAFMLYASGYGILCSAQALGKFGAVSVVSGHIRGKTNTLPLHIEILYNEYNFTAAFAVASVLVLLAIIVLILRNLIEHVGKASLQVSNLKADVAND